MVFGLVLESSITDVKDFTSWNIFSLRTDFVNEFVDDSGVGKGASGHDFIVTSSGSVGVEIDLFDSFALKVPGGR